MRLLKVLELLFAACSCQLMHSTNVNIKHLWSVTNNCFFSYKLICPVIYSYIQLKLLKNYCLKICCFPHKGKHTQKNDHDAALAGQQSQASRSFKAIAHHLKILSWHVNENNKRREHTTTQHTQLSQAFLLNTICPTEKITSNWIKFVKSKADLRWIYTLCYSKMQTDDVMM